MADIQKPPRSHTTLETIKCDSSSSFEEAATGYKGAFPEDLPARTSAQPVRGGWRGRLRSRFWTFSPSSFSLVNTPSGRARARRLAMIAILLLRTAASALSILSAVAKRNVAGIVVYSLLMILSFWFTATCLAVIGDAAGDERVNGAVIKRWFFDAFLGFTLLVCIILLVLFFFGLGGLGLELSGIGVWFLILGVAWIAGWEPEVKMPKYAGDWAT